MQSYEKRAESLRRLHERVRKGELEASNEVAFLLLLVLPGRWSKSFPRVCSEAVVTAVEDAILDYLRAPDRFEPSRSVPLEAYVFLAAKRNLIDVCRRQNRQTEIEAKHRACILTQARSLRTGSSETNPRAAALLALVPSGRERNAFILWLAGEPPDAIARAIGLASGGHTASEVRRLVQRVVKRLRRAAKRSPNS